jgi:hypothetical protein
MKTSLNKSTGVIRLLVLAVLLTLARTGSAETPGGSKDLGAIWFVGDSITQSNADENPNGSPRKALYDLLIAHGYAFSFTGHWKGSVDGLLTAKRRRIACAVCWMRSMHFQRLETRPSC